MADTKTTPAPAAAPAETKEAAFVRLANGRVSKALVAIDVIGNLASPNYKYTQEQVDKIIQALTAEVGVLQARFAKPEAATAKGFSL